MNPKISIILPVFQVEKYIENCAISICQQTFKDFEVIIVNDGTLDNSITIVEKIFKEKSIQFHTINQINRGVSCARNIGILSAKGEWIICIDSDDYLNPNFLDLLFHSTLFNNSNVSIGNFQFVSEKNFNFQMMKLTKKTVVIEQKKALKMFLKRDIKIIIPAMLINREWLTQKKITYDENTSFSEDQLYIWKIIFESDNILFNKTIIYNYLIRPNSTMTSSKIEKVMTGYIAFSKFKDELIKCGQSRIASQIMSRWIFGVLRSFAKMSDFSKFQELAKKINYRNYIRVLIFFPDLRVIILSCLLVIKLKLFYKISKI